MEHPCELPLKLNQNCSSDESDSELDEEPQDNEDKALSTKNVLLQTICRTPQKNHALIVTSYASSYTKEATLASTTAAATGTNPGSMLTEAVAIIIKEENAVELSAHNL